MAGCEVAYHVAAVSTLAGGYERLYAANVLGTQSLIDAATRAGVPRLVHVSTEQVLADGSPKRNVDETHPYTARAYRPYSTTKAEAERRVLAANGPGLTTVAVRPRWVWGPRDHVLPELAAMARSGRLFWISGGGALTSTCHVANLCHALILAAERGGGGEAYFVSDGDPVTVRAFVTGLLETQGIAPPRRDVPFFVVSALVRVVELLWIALPGNAPITRTEADALGQEFTIDIGKARRDLGYAPVVSRAEGMAALRI
jgi:nucleoside-diphosphate-sugar epimerase